MIPSDLPKYEKLIFKIANKFPFKYRKELYQELYIQMHYLLNRYEESRGTFQTFCYKRLYYHCIDYINQNRLNHPSLDEVTFNIDSERLESKANQLVDMCNHFESNFILEDYIEFTERNMKIKDRLIRKDYRNGESIKDIMEDYSIKSPKTVKKILNK